MIILADLDSLQAGQKLELAAGDILRVTVAFNAAVPQATTTELWVSLVIEPARDYTVKTTVSLQQSASPLPYSVDVDMPISTTVGLANTTYDLWAELPSFSDAQVKISGAISITGMPAGMLEGIGSMIALMMVMMMMSMMMENMRDIYEPVGTPPRPKPVTEAVVKGAKTAAKYTGKVVKEVVKYYGREGGYYNESGEY